MLKKNELESGYNDLINRHWDIYENDWYEVVFQYPVDENHKKINVKNPVFGEEGFAMLIIPKEKGRVLISTIITRKEDPDLEIADGANLFHPDMHDGIYFRDMHNATGEWAEGGQTIVEINDLIEEVFPGYCITKKRTW